MNNLEKLRKQLAENESTSFLISNMTNTRWLTGFSGSFGMVVVTPDDARFLTDSRYRIQSEEEVREMPCRSFARPKTATEFLAEQLAEMSIAQLAFDAASVTVASYQEWSEAMPDIQFSPATDPCSTLRMIKSDDELKILRRACQLADECMEHVVQQVRPGVTERELLQAIHQFLFQRHSEASFPPIVVSGPRSARPHGTASDRPLAPGDFVTIDLGAIVDGYCSDMTRTVLVGPAEDRHREVYRAVLDAENACIQACVSGANGRDLDALARKVLGPLQEHFTHGLGHGLGLVVHDTGRLTSSVDQPIAAGQVWTIEPGVYLEDFGGVRIEDVVVVTDDGPEILTHFPKDLLEIP